MTDNTFLTEEQSIANKIRETIQPALREVCEVVDFAKKNGIIVNFSINADPVTGKTVVGSLTLMKSL